MSKNKNDMKIALCLAGQLRTYKQTYGHLKHNIIDDLEPDIFIHTENRIGVTNRVNLHDNQMDDLGTDRRILKKFYNPIDIEVMEPPDNIHKRFKGIEVPDELIQAESPPNSPNRWKGNLPNFYGIYRCNELKKQHEQNNNFTYDLVIRMRPDIQIKDNIPNRVFKRPDVLWHEKDDFLVSDQLAVSNSENMDYYSSVWTKLEEYWQNPLGNGGWKTRRVGERLMRTHMRRSSIPVRSMDIEAELLRTKEAFKKRIQKEMSPVNKINRCLSQITMLKIIKGIKRPSEALNYIREL